MLLEEKMKSKWHILLFGIATFILTALGLVIVYRDELGLTLWSLFAYVIALPCLYVFLVGPLLRSGELNGKKFLLLTFSVAIMAIAVTSSLWTVTAPNWSFAVATGKPTYELGESVQITVSLKNLGFMSHSFTSRISKPIIVSISYVHEENPTVTTQVWFSPYQNNRTEFTILPQQSLERTFTWNQTDSHQPEKNIEPGTYLIEALIPSAGSDMPIGADNLFSAEVLMNITAT